VPALVFVDTSAWYAAADADDASHDRAKRHLGDHAGRLVTSDHVLIETWYLATSRLGRDIGEQLVNGIRGGIARVEATQLADLEAAATIHQQFPDQRFSIVDRTSWSVMRRLGLTDAISFDADFSIYRFGPNRRQALTVHA